MRPPPTRNPLGGTTVLAWCIRACVLTLIMGSTTACMGWGDVDPFRNTYRTICADLQLHQFEDEKYYVTDKRSDDKVLVGPVQKLGWGKGEVVAWEQSTSDRFPSGWYVIDCGTRVVIGPLSQDHFAERRESSAIPVLESAVAWKKLSN